jgi:Cu/Ag efflux pump CusA
MEVNRAEAARYGLTIADVQQLVTSGIGGDMITSTIHVLILAPEFFRVDERASASSRNFGRIGRGCE